MIDATDVPDTFADLATDLERTLTRWHPTDPGQTALRERYLAFVDARGADAMRRGGGREHVTASAFVLSPDRSSILLCFHRKGGFWVQFGGHLEAGDATLALAALREAREESGLLELTRIGATPVDLDRHELSSRFGHCAAHWDVGYAFTAPADATPVVSDESEDVRWWPLDALPSESPPDFPDRVAAALAAAAHAGPGAGPA